MKLWVREAWDCWACMYDRKRHTHKAMIVYRADKSERWIDLDADTADMLQESIRHDGERKWRPSIHMPRWASRITLEIVSVRVERVQDISLDDCWAEGTQIPVSHDGRVLLRLTGQCPPCDYLRPIDAPAGETHSYDEIARAQFASLWDSINAKRGLAWEANPWVWVIDFRRIEP